MSHTTISIPFGADEETTRWSTPLIILSDTEAEVMTIPVALHKITPEAAATAIVTSPTATPDLAIKSDSKVQPSEAPPFEAPPFFDYVPSSHILARASSDYYLRSNIALKPMEDEYELIEDAPEAAKPLPAQRCRSPLPASAKPPPDVLPHRRSSTPLPDTTTEAVIPEFVIPEAMAPVDPVRRRRMIEARCWTFSVNGIDTWRHQEGEPRYEIEEGSSAQIHPITVEPIHRIIPLLVARRKMRTLRARVVSLDGENMSLRAKVRAAQLSDDSTRVALQTARTGLPEVRRKARDTAEQLQQCRIARIQDRERISRIKEYIRRHF
uniref:Uncharacterized protein n=1 Tax=Tanacetum cinerariifolium TaxID=118510 RepID=A0A699HVH7_TANCI|nr:hypothetical protein [Tanacetum cinerariifolium]